MKLRSGSRVSAEKFDINSETTDQTQIVQSPDLLEKQLKQKNMTSMASKTTQVETNLGRNQRTTQTCKSAMNACTQSEVILKAERATEMSSSRLREYNKQDCQVQT